MALDIDRDTAHDLAQQELSKPIYPKESFGQSVNEWVEELVYKLLVRSSEVPGGWVTITILGTLLVVALVVAIRIAGRAMRTRRGGDFAVLGDSELTAAEHRVTAERYAAQADWSSAIRHRLRAIARQLEESNVLTPVPGRTANELARGAAQAVPDLTSELDRAATSFNDVTYGERPGTEAEYQAITALDEHIRTRPALAASAPAAAGSGSWTQIE